MKGSNKSPFPAGKERVRRNGFLGKMPMMKISRRRIVAGIGYFMMGSVGTCETPHSQAVMLTSHENGTEPQSGFPCAGTIYAYITFPEAEIGKHELEGIWTGPQGISVRRSLDEIDFPPPGKRTAVLWLEFPHEDPLWDPLSLRGPDEADRRAYDGEWRVQIRWDGQDFARSDFTVRCQ